MNINIRLVLIVSSFGLILSTFFVCLQFSISDCLLLVIYCLVMPH